MGRLNTRFSLLIAYIDEYYVLWGGLGATRTLGNLKQEIELKCHSRACLRIWDSSKKISANCSTGNCPIRSLILSNRTIIARNPIWEKSRSGRFESLTRRYLKLHRYFCIPTAIKLDMVVHPSFTVDGTKNLTVLRIARRTIMRISSNFCQKEEIQDEKWTGNILCFVPVSREDLTNHTTPQSVSASTNQPSNGRSLIFHCVTDARDAQTFKLMCREICRKLSSRFTTSFHPCPADSEVGPIITGKRSGQINLETIVLKMMRCRDFVSCKSIEMQKMRRGLKWGVLPRYPTL